MAPNNTCKMSPRQKKAKTDANKPNSLKRKNEDLKKSSKRFKSEKNNKEELQDQNNKNFLTACKQVSYKAYCDYRSRLLLVYLPSCVTENGVCEHNNNSITAQEILPHAEEAFMINARQNMWYDALEVCVMCITTTQYLSANVLKEVVEIILNAHEDEFADYPISYLVDQCQQILQQNISMHPPCLTEQIRQCYKKFLISSLDQKEKSFTNRDQFGYDKGIVKYCMNRLEYEISSESKDECIVDKYENIPEEMQRSVQGFYWQKEKFEIYECLERKERIDRIMAVLESIIELLQFDLAIWIRYTDNSDNRIRRSHKPLMAFVLWPNNIRYAGRVNNNCRQIFKIYAQMVHLQYPDRLIKIMTMWLNAVTQTCYICDINSNKDYPRKDDCSTFAGEFYKIISDMPQESIIRILETVKPVHMKYLLGNLHLKNLLSTEEDCIIENLIDFIKQSKWKKYPKAKGTIILSKDIFREEKRAESRLSYLSKLCKSWKTMKKVPDFENDSYAKMDLESKNDRVINRNHVVHTLYLTLEACLDAYSVQGFKETLDHLCDETVQSGDANVTSNQSDLSTYSVTEELLEKYRSIYVKLKNLTLLLQKSKRKLPNMFSIFENINISNLVVAEQYLVE